MRAAFPQTAVLAKSPGKTAVPLHRTRANLHPSLRPVAPALRRRYQRPRESARSLVRPFVLGPDTGFRLRVLPQNLLLLRPPGTRNTRPREAPLHTRA